MNDLQWIKSVLSNDEYSTDQELAAYFVSQGLSETEAAHWVSQRQFYLNNIVMHDEEGNDIGVYTPSI